MAEPMSIEPRSLMALRSPMSEKRWIVVEMGAGRQASTSRSLTGLTASVAGVGLCGSVAAWSKSEGPWGWLSHGWWGMWRLSQRPTFSPPAAWRMANIQ